ncbi:YbaK/EbsC family protein [Halobaculum sp. D14]|uniref:YbaK/EbsC family protein n=1 Tax=Halobaculum sp. D14 TaxID=3421642 RepID=UPI003EB8AFDE
MHPTAERFADRARAEYDFEASVEEFPDGTKTAADAADAVGCTVGQIVKSIVLTADGDPVVVLTAGDHRVDEDGFAAAVGADAVEMADADEVKAATGWSIGGVPPFCHDTDLPVYLDESLTAHDTVWAAAGTPEAVFAVAPDALRRIASPEPVAAFTEA